jgi:hypothetical protein
MKMRNILLMLSALIALAGVAPRVHAQTAGTETITLIDGSCITTAPCTMQLYKATLAAGVTTCPAVGAASYTALTTTQLSTSVGIVNSAWTYADSALAFGTSYCWYATVTYTSGGSASPPSLVLQQTIPVQAPAAPTLSGSFSAS